MQSASESRAIEFVTAVLLGIVSLVTALLAWQGQSWTMASESFERDSANARDVAVTQSVLADYSRSTDAEVSAKARLLFEAYVASTDPLEQLTLSNAVATELSRASPYFSDAWYVWGGLAFPDDAPALDDEDYLVQRDGYAQSYAYVARLTAGLEDSFKERAQILAQASLTNALSLFLIGIAGVFWATGAMVGAGSRAAWLLKDSMPAHGGHG